jgi:hypothetical protein
MLKKSIVMLVGLLLFLFAAAPAMAAINVTVDGEALNFDVEPAIVDGRTMVPMRAIFEALGATVEWDAAEQKIIAKSTDDFGFEDTMEMWINNPAVTVYGYRGVGAEIILDVPPMLIGGRTMVPTRFVAESLGATVNWIGETDTVEILSAPGTTPAVPDSPPAVPDSPAAVVADPNIDFELVTGEYQGSDFIADAVFTNTGNVKITEVVEVSVRVYLQTAAGEQVLLTDGTFQNLAVDLEPGQSVTYILTFTDVTVYEDVTSCSGEAHDWEYDFEV